MYRLVDRIPTSFYFAQEIRSMSENLKDYGISDTRRYKVEAWFDEHPIPWEIDAHTFGVDAGQIDKVTVYFCDEWRKDFLIKILCKNARRAEYLSRLFYKTTSQMDIEQILIYKELFLLRRSF